MLQRGGALPRAFQGLSVLLGKHLKLRACIKAQVQAPSIHSEGIHEEDIELTWIPEHADGQQEY